MSDKQKEAKLKALQLTLDKMEKSYGKGVPLCLNFYTLFFAKPKLVILAIYGLKYWALALAHSPRLEPRN